jgi:predicted site-specific integrase-resolvase
MRDTAGSDVPGLRPPVGPGEFEPFLTAREVAERLRIAPCTVLRYFEDGVLPGRRLRAGRFHPVRFRWSEIEAALNCEDPRR